MATEIGRWIVGITPEVDRKASQEVGEDIEDAIGGPGGGTDRGKKIGSRLTKGLSAGLKIGGAAVAATATAIGTTLVGLGTKAIRAQADIEQAVGGAEAVFEGSSDAVMRWAGNAANAVGLSSNAALEVANVMGSLLQGSGFNAKESAEMTMNWSKRAADVASIMGISIESAMEAITGAAKGNFTMMDNLGVAMNATTLEAYAQSKGMEQAYISMDNATKVGLAYQLFMDQTAKYANNFEAENQTLAGSFTILSAAWENLFYSLGDENMMKGASEGMITAMDNVIASVSDAAPMVLENLGTMMETLLPKMMSNLADNLPGLIDLLLVSIEGLMDGLAEGMEKSMPMMDKLLPKILEVLLNLLQKLLDVTLTMLGPMISALISGILGALPQLIVIVDQLQKDILTKYLPMILKGLLGGLIKGLGLLIVGLAPIIDERAREFMAILGHGIDVGLQWIGEKWDGFWGWLGDIFSNAGAAMSEAWNNMWSTMADSFNTIFARLGVWFSNTMDGISNGIRDMSSRMTSAAREWMDNLVQGLHDGINRITSWATALPGRIVNALLQKIGEIKNVGKDIVRGLWDGITSTDGWLLGRLREWSDKIVGGVKDFFKIASPSKLMRDEVGMEIGAGVGAGIAASARGIMKQATDFSKLVSSGINITGSAAHNVTPARATGGNTTNVFQTVEKPDSMLDIYIQTQRGARAGGRNR